MKLRNQFEFLFVGKEEGSFLENYSYDLGEGEEDAGQLFVNVEIQNNPADAELIAETIFDSARKIFFSDLEKDVYTRFEDALKEVNTAINAFKAETVSHFIGNLHVIMGVVAGNELHLSQTGDAEAYLLRKRYCSIISEGLSDHSVQKDETFANIASGTIEPGDFILFSTTRLLRYISKSDFIQTLKSQDLVGSLGDLKDALSPEILSKIGIIGMTFHEGLSELTNKEITGVREYLEDEKPERAQHLRLKPNKIGAVFNGIGDRIVHYMNNVLKGMTSKQMTKDKILALLIIVIVLLTAVIWYVKNSGATQREIEKLDEILVQVQEEINTASLRGRSNKDAAADILTDAQQKAVEVLNSGYHRSKANELLGLIQEEKTKLDNVTYVSAPRVVADLSTKRENVSILGLIPYKDQVFAFEYNALYRILLDQVENPITIDDNETVVAGAYDSNNNALIFATKNGKIIYYVDGRFQFMDTPDGSFHSAIAMDVYNGKMYLLDPTTKQIWKYVKNREAYGNAEQYITSGELGDVIDIAIDGYVYVLQTNGEIAKFDRGTKTDFVVSEAPLDVIAAPTKIYTELDLDKIFILEPSKNRVLVLNKDLDTGGASYSGQYVFDGIGEMKDIFFDKGSNKLYVVDSQKLYEVGI
ncbi:hypothetical protein C0416_00425 [bacterium]|nr:hypothetical protein [bacterium]